MTPGAWKILDDLGILSAVGAVSVAVVLGAGKLIRSQWAAHKVRQERIAAHLEATIVLLDFSLRAVVGADVTIIRQRAALQERLREARERLLRCKRKGE